MTTMKLKWIVEFEVEDKLISGGFRLDDKVAMEMLRGAIQLHAYSHELGAKVVSAPTQSEIDRCDGKGEDEDGDDTCDGCGGDGGFRACYCCEPCDNPDCGWEECPDCDGTGRAVDV